MQTSEILKVPVPDLCTNQNMPNPVHNNTARIDRARASMHNQANPKRLTTNQSQQRIILRGIASIGEVQATNTSTIVILYIHEQAGKLSYLFVNLRVIHEINFSS